MSIEKISGGCACGAVRYNVFSKPGFSFHCHCNRCQHATGSGHASGMMVQRNDVTISGNLSSYEVEADSGFVANHQFCGKCGSPVFSSTARFPDTLSIYAGSLDDTSIFEPTQVLYFGNAPQWDYIDPALK